MLGVGGLGEDDFAGLDVPAENHLGVGLARLLRDAGNCGVAHEAHAGTKGQRLAGLDPQRSTILRTFLGQIPLMVYRDWVEGGKTIPLTEVADLAVALTCHGTEGYLEATGAREGDLPTSQLDHGWVRQ